MNLPQEFLSRMQKRLGTAYPAFLRCYEQPPVKAVRANLLKVTAEEFALAPFAGERVPWAEGGFYTQAEGLGHTPAHHAGLFYAQEPSAMCAAPLLGAKPGERVLDLCAAPGGKTTQLAAAMRGEGVLVANEYVFSRARILSQNVERLGIGNCAVVSADPAALARALPCYFDKVLVDAPCSGEGMFRKSPDAAREWTPDSPAACAARQAEILNSAFKMLKPGGVLVYSTCTLNAKENEETVARVLDAHANIQLYPIKAQIPQPKLLGVNASDAVIEGTVRIMPHLADGEGHFCARFLKTDGEVVRVKPLRRAKNGAFDKAFTKFCAQYLNVRPADDLFFGEYGYSAPPDCPDLDRLRVLRAGVQLGRLVKDRFEPSHSFALALTSDEIKNSLSFDEGAKELTAYLCGETLPCAFDGWATVCVNGLPFGWGKASNGVLKNHIPKGLRINR